MLATETSIFLIHIALTYFMIGLIWIVQIVHYPLFDRVDLLKFKEFETSHSNRISWIVAPIMTLELLTGFMLALGTEIFVFWINLGIIVMIWLSTFFLSIPMHRVLSQGYDVRAHKRLVETNWVRTILWTIRGIILIYIGFSTFLKSA